MDERFEILRVGHQGDGIADGPVFAPRTLPGEIVTGNVDGSLLTDIRIAEPSSARVQPVCRHYKSCGGCQLQHASDEFVADWKQQIVLNALSAHGLETTIRGVMTSNKKSRRRAVVSARRTKKGALAGFHSRASDTIIQIPDCQLLDSKLLDGLGLVEDLAILGASRKGEVSVNLTLSENGLDVAVTGGKPADGPVLISLAQMAERYDIARLTWDDETISMRRPPIQRFGNADVVPPPGAFLQATTEGEAALVEAVKEVVSNANHVADLFSGCGTFSLPLAERCKVHAYEGDASMIKALDNGWRNTNGLKKVTSEVRDLFRRPLLPEELKGFDVVVMDPPRAGAEAQTKMLCQSEVEVVAYVSCNPVTFARDAKNLVSSGFKLDWLQVVDQFRWSAHVELVAAFSRN